MKAVMYHYVRPFNPKLPYFKNLHFDDFKRQLDFFTKEYGFVQKADFFNAFTTGELPKGVVLTFDDGLSCHFEYVFHELQARGLWGIFYVPTQPYTESKLLDVHRTHILLGSRDSKPVYTFLSDLVEDYQIDQEKLMEFKRFTYTTQENDNFTLGTKRMLNYYLAYDHREQVMDQLMQRFVPDEEKYLSSYYLEVKQIKAMKDAGMLIGSHTVHHPVMSRLTEAEQVYEIEASFDLLEGITGVPEYRTFCYPYGGFHSFTDLTEALLTKNRCLFSFNVEQRDIKVEDVLQRPQALPRYDCNRFKYGQCRN